MALWTTHPQILIMDWFCIYGGFIWYTKLRVTFPVIFHHSKGREGRVKQSDYFGQYHFFACLYFMSLMKYIRILVMFLLKMILSFISNGNNVYQQMDKNGGMSIHTSKIAIAGSLGMSKESKCLEKLF